MTVPLAEEIHTKTHTPVAHSLALIGLGALVLLLASCSRLTQLHIWPASPTSTPPPAESLVAPTSGPAFTLTVPPIALTLIGTASATPTLTPTSLPRLPSFTAVTSATPTPTESATAWSCNVIAQSLRNGAHFNPRDRFEMGWKVRNNGTAAWDPGSVVFAYFSGAKMYQAESYMLAATVDPGTTTSLGAGMLAPRSSGSYTTVWSLRRGTEDFCHVSLRIIVP